MAIYIDTANREADEPMENLRQTIERLHFEIRHLTEEITQLQSLLAEKINTPRFRVPYRREW